MVAPVIGAAIMGAALFGVVGAVAGAAFCALMLMAADL